jgi:hypothetical protein
MNAWGGIGETRVTGVLGAMLALWMARQVLPLVVTAIPIRGV